MSGYPTHLTVSHCKGLETTKIDKPLWSQVEQALQQANESSIDWIHLENRNDFVEMTVFGAPDVYHVSYYLGAEDEHFYCWNGSGDSKTHVEIGTHLFPDYQVISEFELLTRVVKHFFETGHRYLDVRWVVE